MQRPIITADMVQNPERTVPTENTGTTSIYNISDERPLFILAVSLSGAGVVLLISTLFLCCYFYRTRLRRRNYPLTSLTLENRDVGRFSHTRTSTVINDENNGLNLTNSNRPRSPVTTEADIYGLDALDGRGKHSKDSRLEEYPSIKISNGNGAEKPISFDNPMYKKNSLTPTNSNPLEFVQTPPYVRKGSAPAIIRKSSSSSSSILPHLPTMMVVDESAEDRRLVPNDWLSLEIERGQRWLRDCREAQRNAFESERTSNTATDHSSLKSESMAAKRDADLVDSSLSAAAAIVVQPQPRKRLRRKLAETIANERVLETTVTFTNETLDSPTSPSMLLPWPGSLLGVDARNRSSDIKRRGDSDDDDLEVIFKERTPL